MLDRESVLNRIRESTRHRIPVYVFCDRSVTFKQIRQETGAVNSYLQWIQDPDSIRGVTTALFVVDPSYRLHPNAEEIAERIVLLFHLGFIHEALKLPAV